MFLKKTDYRMGTACRIFLMTAGIWLLSNAPAFSSTYNIFVIETEETAGSDLYPYAINDSGHAALGLRGDDGYMTAAFFDGSSISILPRVYSEAGTTPNDISNTDCITGSGDNSDGYDRTFIWNGSSLQVLEPENIISSEGYGINDSGQVAGYIKDADSVTYGFFYDGNNITDIGNLGGNRSYAHDVNNSGHITGNSRDASGVYHAFYYDGTAMTDLGTLGEGKSCGTAINNLDHIAGYFKDSNNDDTAFIWDAENGMISLGKLTQGSNSEVNDINDSDQVVGNESSSYAVLWKNGTVYNLNELVVSDKTLTDAVSINNNGWILCQATLSGTTYSVILKPADSGTGIIYGCVTSEVSGYSAPVKDATVFIESLSISAQTDKNGNFRLINVPFGDYTVEIQADNFQDKSLTVTLPENGDTEIPDEDLVLEPENIIFVDADNASQPDLAQAVYVLQILSGQ